MDDTTDRLELTIDDWAEMARHVYGERARLVGTGDGGFDIIDVSTEERVAVIQTAVPKGVS